MKTGVTHAKRVRVLLGALVGLLLWSPLVEAGTVVVQVAINSGNALGGNKGDALISVLVTNPLDGSPVDNLGATIARNDVTGITLPSGWTLFSGFNVRFGGCTASTTEFSNLGSGIYDIRIVPALGNPSCTWLSGDYVYAVEINVTVGTSTFKGGSLGVLSVP